MNGRRRANGFTLVEVLVAMAITAFIGAAAYAAFYVAMDTGDNNLEKARTINELDRAMWIIERDMHQVIARSVVTGYGDAQSAFEGVENAYDSLDQYLLRFTRDGWRNPRQHHRSDLLRVGYRLFEGALWRDHWAHLDLVDDSVPPTRLQLLTGVSDIRLRYLSVDTGQQSPQRGEQRWLEQWPPGPALGVGAGISEALPVAVEITFELEEWGEIKRLFALPSA